MSARSTIHRALTILGFAALPTLATAQSPAGPAIGSRVRVSVPEPFAQDQGPRHRQQLRGTLLSITPDTLHLAIPGTHGSLAISRRDVRRLDVSRGRPSRGASAVERALGFAVVGAISAALHNDPRGSKWPNESSAGRAAADGARWGAAIGAVVGFAFPTERWRRVRDLGM